MSIVFVYGTLMRRCGNHRLLETSTLLGRAWTLPEYELLSLGGCPGLVPAGKTSVAGELYRVTPEVLADLDRLEGHPTFYRREPLKLATARLLFATDGARREVVGPKAEVIQGYVLQRPSRGLERIESGSWRRHVADRYPRRIGGVR